MSQFLYSIIFPSQKIVSLWLHFKRWKSRIFYLCTDKISGVYNRHVQMAISHALSSYQDIRLTCNHILELTLIEKLHLQSALRQLQGDVIDQFYGRTYERKKQCGAEKIYDQRGC
ncbi:unnamed protein product [Cuscuta epithymum]|uniref:Uncharacterized protein n=1 Tax=Cuscuta epithymum TaxID=186058 RepID=A0AAV0F7K5_9ASTE|nr:unnamed protein product [Cuscuta epithymum]